MTFQTDEHGKVRAEGSLWQVESALSDAQFAASVDAVKVTTITPQVRKLYFLEGYTPDEKTVALRVDADYATVIVAPDHWASVTPTERA